MEWTATDFESKGDSAVGKYILTSDAVYDVEAGKVIAQYEKNYYYNYIGGEYTIEFDDENDT